jgi:hypothetical protein
MAQTYLTILVGALRELKYVKDLTIHKPHTVLNNSSINPFTYIVLIFSLNKMSNLNQASLHIKTSIVYFIDLKKKYF